MRLCGRAEFRSDYGKIPILNLHSGAAAALLEGPPLRLHQPRAHGVADPLPDRVRLERVHDVGSVGFCGPDARAQFGR